MNVLIACEESQTVCKAFRERGHKAYSCDIQECSGGHPEWHIQCDVLNIINAKNCTEKIQFYTNDGTYHCIDKKWDLIIAFPPCTYLTRAGSVRLFPNGKLDPIRYKKGLQAAEFFYAILNANCERICIENPTPMKIFNLPEPSQVIQPFYFGHNVQKRTLLWLKGLPPLFYTDIVIPDFTVMTYFKSNGKSRSKFWPGVANAMVDQWTKFIDYGGIL